MGKIVRVVAMVAAVALAPATGGASLLGLSPLAAGAIVLGLTVAGVLLAPKPLAIATCWRWLRISRAIRRPARWIGPATTATARPG